MREFHNKSKLTGCGTQLPRDGRPVEYRCRPLLNAGEIFAVVQFRDEKRPAVLSNYNADVHEAWQLWWERDVV